MMWRAIARVVLSSAAVLMLGTMTGMAAQNTDTGTAPSSGVPQNPAPTVAASPTIGSSTSLNSPSNDLASLYGAPVEQIIARVNDRVITNSDLKRAQDQLAEESRHDNWTLTKYDQQKKDLLRDLIDQQLLLSRGKQLSITGDDELIRRLDDIRKKNHLASMGDLEKAVEQQGISYEDFKQNIRNSIITQQVVQQEVGSKMQISQADMTQYYRDHQDQFTHPESVELSEILVPTAEDATGEQLAAADAKAKDVYAKLKAGEDFAALAKQYSGGSTAEQGGTLGDFKRGSLAKVLEDQTFDLPPGGYTAPIRTRQGYIILEVTAHHEGGTAPMSKVEQQIEQAIYMERIQPAVRKYLTHLRTEAYIDIRPGYVDAGASPDESKPTYTAYVPPQPKKKKKKAKERFERVRYGQTAAVAKKEPASGNAANAKPRKIKHEKLRYGRPPLNPVSSEQVAVASNSSSSTSDQNPTSSEEAAEAGATAPGGYVQPLGPDLQHQPTIHPPKQHKWRYSSLAREQSQKEKQEKENKEKKEKQEASAQHREAKAAAKSSAQPTPATPAETANRKVQDAPLGLGGDTAHPKKEKKVKPNNGEKTRFSDRDKDHNEKDNGSGSATPPPSR